MPEGKDVHPKKWKELVILFDDGVYSICWGTFEGNKYTMGQRWNENYPRQGSSPTWYIMYDDLVKCTLEGLKDLISKNDFLSDEKKNEYEDARKKALNEFLVIKSNTDEDLPF